MALISASASPNSLTAAVDTEHLFKGHPINSITWDYAFWTPLSSPSSHVSEKPWAQRSLENELCAATAMKRLAHLRERRAIKHAVDKRMPQTQIARHLSVSQAHISRTLAAIARTPEVIEQKALEAVWRRAVGEITTEEMMATLIAHPWVRGVPRPDSWEPGDWDSMSTARAEGLLTSDEYTQIKQHARALQRPDTASRH